MNRVIEAEVPEGSPFQGYQDFSFRTLCAARGDPVPGVSRGSRRMDAPGSGTACGRHRRAHVGRTSAAASFLPSIIKGQVTVRRLVTLLDAIGIANLQAPGGAGC